MENRPTINPMEIRSLIYTIRGKETKNLNKAIKRNTNRFPVSFCFQLTEE